MLSRPSLANRIVCIVTIACLASLCHSSIAADSASGPVRPFVVGGRDASPSDFPWMVALLDPRLGDTNYDRFFCGGVLIHSEWVLTAAHCIDELEPNEFVIGYGSNDLDVMTRTTQPVVVLPQPAYHVRAWRGGDLALVRLAEPITDIQPIALNWDPVYPQTLSRAKIVGWGDTQFATGGSNHPRKLQEADITLYSREYISQPSVFGNSIHPDYLAAGEASPQRGAFSGDSGGPLLIQGPAGEWMVAGTTSFGSGGCGSPFDHISMFTNVAHFADWIRLAVFEAPWEPSEADIANEFFSEPFIEHTEARGTVLFRKVWPLSSSYEVTTQMARPRYSGPLYWYEHDIFDQHTHSLWLRDGQWYLGDLLDTTLIYGDKLLLRRFTHSKRESETHRYLSLGPTSRISFSGQGASRGNREIVLLRDLRAGDQYRLNSNSSLSYFLTWSQDGTSPLETVSTDFVAQEGANYMAIYQSPRYQSSVALLAGISPVLRPNELITAELGADSPQHREPGFHFDAYRYEGFIDTEAMITLTSTFDGEISVNHSSTGQLMAYHDQEAENAAERLIVSGRGLYNSRIRVINFDENEFGSYTLEVKSHNDTHRPGYPYQAQRAITSDDEAFTHDDGVTQYFETLSLSNLPTNQDVTIRVDGLGRARPGIALFEGDSRDIVGDAYDAICSDGAEIVFRPRFRQDYDLIVAVFGEEDLNTNYEISISSSADNQLRSTTVATRKNYAIRKHRSLDPISVEAKMIEAYLSRP